MKYALLITLCIGLSACGTKPTDTDSTKTRTTYPSSATDPSPAGGPAITLPNAINRAGVP